MHYIHSEAEAERHNTDDGAVKYRNEDAIALVVTC